MYADAFKELYFKAPAPDSSGFVYEASLTYGGEGKWVVKTGGGSPMEATYTSYKEAALLFLLDVAETVQLEVINGSNRTD